MANYSIKDLERLSGVKAHTIRIWEKRYGIVEPKRTDSNIRYYCDSDVKKLMNVSILLHHGYKISRLAGMDSAEISKKVLEVSMVTNGHDSQLESLVVSMIELDEAKFEKILNMAIIKEGFEKTVFKLLYPFFERIGYLWQAGTINPAHEHFITNLVRQKIYVAIESIPMPSTRDARSFLLYLPEWDLHELGLLFYNYILKSRGFKVIYLGASVPEEDIYAVADYLSPDYFLTSFSNAVASGKIEGYLGRLAGHYPQSQFYITGFQLANLACELPPNVQKVESAHKFCEETLPSLK